MQIGKLKFIISCFFSVMLSIMMTAVYSAVIALTGRRFLIRTEWTGEFSGLLILVPAVVLFFTVKTQIPRIQYAIIKSRCARFREAFRLPYKCYPRHTVEKYILLILNDMDEYEAEYYAACKGMTENIGKIAVGATLLLVMERRLLMIVLIPTFLLFEAGVAFRRRTMRLRMAVSGEKGRNRRFLNGQEKLFGQLSILVTFLGLLYAAAAMADGSILLGRAAFLVLLVSVMEENVSALPPAVNHYIAARDRLERAFAEPDEDVDAIKNGSGVKGAHIGFSFKKDILCRRLAFSYGNRVICRPFDLCLPYGMKYLLTGKSGAGKTTLINLLTGVYETYEGTILYDDVELRQISRKEFHEAVAVIHQDIYLFEDTIRRNICLFCQCSEEELVRAVGMAGLSEWVEKLSQGLDTTLTDNGKEFPEGTKQRIAIARALMRRPCLLVADGISSGLSREAAERIENTLLSLDTTVIVVSRRDCSRGKGYDAVIKMAQGKAVLMPCEGEDSYDEDAMESL